MLFRTHFFAKALLLLCVTLILQNCTTNELVENLPTTATAQLIDPTTAEDVEYYTGTDEVWERTDGDFSFETLNQALECTGLKSALQNGLNTVYAPSDAAFAKLGLDADNICTALDTETLSNILLYHVSLGEIVSIFESGCLSTANGEIAQLKRDGFRRFINDARIYFGFPQFGRDFRLRVYAITDVLGVPDVNIVGTAAGVDVFSSLVAAVTAADPTIAAALSNEDATFTVFAPTNEAFAKLVETLGAGSLTELVEQVGVEALSTILLYHVVDACAFSNDLSNGQELTTLQGETVKVNLRKLQLIDKSEDSAGLVKDLLDVRTSNGIVHGIDKVLLPQAILDVL